MSEHTHLEIHEISFSYDELIMVIASLQMTARECENKLKEGVATMSAPQIKKCLSIARVARTAQKKFEQIMEHGKTDTHEAKAADN